LVARPTASSGHATAVSSSQYCSINSAACTSNLTALTAGGRPHRTYSALQLTTQHYCVVLHMHKLCTPAIMACMIRECTLAVAQHYLLVLQLHCIVYCQHWHRLQSTAEGHRGTGEHAPCEPWSIPCIVDVTYLASPHAEISREHRVYLT
jgi:hypothetical protein